MTKLCPVILAAAVLAGTARAANVTLASSTPVGSPITVAAGVASVPVNVFIFNDVGTDPPSGFMKAWQFDLRLVPDAGATGTLSLATPATGAVSPPSSYIFAAGVGITATNSGSGLTANDFDTASGGTQVPTANRNLM